ncbi:alanyl-tRNA synthetase domain-containing protein 1 [Thecamonas trahens ATCC 50062]|uniref:Alanyl-tRNA synthetase domain-containing protein 1 n=1 Tax=Thecamonas trahens ATCC 50062 TaxID=461836 RepID=A0A0L0DMZ2_THETB|nr:alanyl-tRNA synthetase domain-containing protein 1 [Thecamonas trahens ATCC 50062]KNC53674.1 alanyl-tRNA synthetase domain-containing protein 1 [Thecamonas trahens ATCC 50062]|eukprot:XP_013761988.1 alanyl-tRNA synthetase domain-containing protein 1 [Thecamonas trahens ATCC 50062]
MTTAATVLAAADGGDGEWDVVLDKTVVFPEGGGQPADTGRLCLAETVLDVVGATTAKTGPDAGVVHHRVAACDRLAVESLVGESVVVKVAEARRIDHMQQHSAQHLVSAVAAEVFGAATVSWELGSEATAIDVELTAAEDDVDVAALEARINALIRARTPVTSHVVDRAAMDALVVAGEADGTKFRSRGLPDSVTEGIRLVAIAGVDLNTCCGTHVTNLSELQAIKLLPPSRSKKHPTKMQLSYVAGQRVLDRVASAVVLSSQLNKALGSAAWLECIASYKSAAKEMARTQKALVAQLASSQADVARDAACAAGSPLAHIHQPAGDAAFAKSAAARIHETHPGLVVFVTCGSESGAGIFTLVAAAEPGKSLVDAVGKQAASLMDGRGGGKGGKFQGKVANLGARGEVVALIEARSGEGQSQDQGQ